MVDETAEDFEDVKMISIKRADLGKEILINPDLHVKDKLRKFVYHDSKTAKNPDIRENGILRR